MIFPLDFVLGAFLAIFAVPFLLFAGLLYKRLPLFVGIILLMKQVGSNTQVIVRSVLILLALLGVVIGSGVVGIVLLLKAVSLWI